MSKKIVALFLSLILVLGSATAFAANLDLKNKTTGVVTPLDDVLLDDDLFIDVAFDIENYTVEFGGKLYNLKEVQNKFDADPTLTMEEAVSGLTPVGDVEQPGDLKVVKVSAINGTNDVVALNGATVQRNATFKIVLNEAFDKTTVSNNTIKIMKGNDIVAITTPKTYQNTIEFATFATLEANTEYKLVVDGIKSADGKSAITNKTLATFNTNEESVVRTVTTTMTAGGSTIYSYDGTATANIANSWSSGDTFNVTFDEAIDDSTLNSSTVQLVNKTTGKSLAVKATIGAANNIVDVKIVGVNDFLMPKERYELKINGVKNAAGVEVASFNLEFSYQEAGPRTIAVGNVTIGSTSSNPGTGNTVANLVNPTLTSTLLSDRQTLAEAAKLVVDFGAANAKLDETTVNSDNFYIRTRDSKEKVAVNVKYQEGLNRVEVSPVSPLKEATEYELVVGPYVKNIYGIAKGTNDAAIDVVPFKTLDITAPTVEKVEGDLNNLQIGKEREIKITLSEPISAVAKNTVAYTSFIAGSGDGNISLFRADDNSQAHSLMTTPSLSNDGKVITVKVTPNAAARGKSYKMILAGYHPTRTDAAMIVDKADQYIGGTQLTNKMASDYTFGVNVEGADTTAPKVIDAKGTVVAGTEVALDGATNVNGAIKIKLDDKAANINITNAVVTFTNNAGAKTIRTIVSVTDDLGNAVLTITNPGTAGLYELKLTGLKDTTGNEMSTYTAKFSAGNGPRVSKVEIKDVNDKANNYVAGVSDASKSAFKVTFGGAVDKSTVTNTTVKLMAGTTEIPVELDKDKLETAGQYYVVLKPTQTIEGNKDYTVVVTKDVKDAVGNSLQQVTTLAPADHKVTLKTVNDAKPELDGSAVIDETNKTITLTFKDEVAKTSTLTLTNPATGLTEGIVSTPVWGGASKNNKKQLVFSVHTLAKDITYNAELNVYSNVNSESSTITFDVATTKDWVAPLPSAALTKVVPTINSNGEFTLSFGGTQAVKISTIEGMKVKNTTTGAELSLGSARVTASGTLLDKDGKVTVVAADAVYATSFDINLPGIYEKATEFEFAVAKGTEFFTDVNGTKSQSSAELKYIVVSQAKLSDAEIVALDKNALSTTETITADGPVILPTTGSNGSVIGWAKTTDTSIVASLTGNTVTFTRSSADNTDDTVVLTATITKGASSATQTVTYTVKEAKAPIASKGSTDIATSLDVSIDETATVAITGSATLRSGETVSVTGTAGTSATFTITNAGAILGDSFTFSVTDAAGNVSSYTATWNGSTWTIA